MKTVMLLTAAAALGCAVGSADAAAQQAQPGMPGHEGMMPGVTVPDDPAARAYLESMQKMHRDMAVELTGDADRDFAQVMIPHHQGAIDMARVVLEYGKDPEVRELAQRVIQEQEKEIKQLQEWLQNHPNVQ